MTPIKLGGTLPKNEKNFALKRVILKAGLKKLGLKYWDMNEKTIKAATNIVLAIVGLPFVIQTINLEKRLIDKINAWRKTLAYHCLILHNLFQN